MCMTGWWAWFRAVRPTWAAAESTLKRRGPPRLISQSPSSMTLSHSMCSKEQGQWSTLMCSWYGYTFRQSPLFQKVSSFKGKLAPIGMGSDCHLWFNPCWSLPCGLCCSQLIIWNSCSPTRRPRTLWTDKLTGPSRLPPPAKGLSTDKRWKIRHFCFEVPKRVKIFSSTFCKGIFKVET